MVRTAEAICRVAGEAAQDGAIPERQGRNGPRVVFRLVEDRGDDGEQARRSLEARVPRVLVGRRDNRVETVRVLGRLEPDPVGSRKRLAEAATGADAEHFPVRIDFIGWQLFLSGLPLPPDLPVGNGDLWLRQLLELTAEQFFIDQLWLTTLVVLRD